MFLSKERKIKTLSEVSKLFPSLNNFFDFTSSLIEVNKETIESVYNNVNEDNVNKVYQVLEYALTVRFLNRENILRLIGLLITKFGYNRLYKRFFNTTGSFQKHKNQ